MGKFLIVTDGKAGHENQSKAFCRALGKEFELLKVEYRSPVMKGMAYLCDRIGIKTGSVFSSGAIQDPTGIEAVVCTGSTAFYPGKVIARRLRVPVAAILYPKGYRMDFDCILAPEFDRPSPRPNLVPVPVNLTVPDPDFYANGVQQFRSRFPQGWDREGKVKSAVGVIVGGPNGFAEMTVKKMKPLLDSLFAATPGQNHWVTTSRRTPPEVETLIAGYPFEYQLLFSQDHFNPIPAFVSLCDRLFVTADSTGMISEAVTCGHSQVEVLMNLKDDTSKFARFVHDLERRNAVHIFDGKLGYADNKVNLTTAFEKARVLLFGKSGRI